jgi:hypothetical protein
MVLKSTLRRRIKIFQTMEKICQKNSATSPKKFEAVLPG